MGCDGRRCGLLFRWVDTDSDGTGRWLQYDAFEASRIGCEAVECDFPPNTATEFTAEVFLSGKSVCRCQIWLGGMHSSDGISYAEG